MSGWMIGRPANENGDRSAVSGDEALDQVASTAQPIQRSDLATANERRAELPTGTVTLMFTDVEDSTGLVLRLGERYAEVLSKHRDLIRGAIVEHQGQEVDTQGDGFVAVFGRADDAVKAALTAQRALMAQPWPADAQVRVRMGLHTGEPIWAHGAYVGLDLHRASRICDAGHGGQILLSEVSYALIEHSIANDGVVRDLGPHHLRGMPRPERIFQLTYPGLQADFPPLRSLAEAWHNLPRELTSFIGREREIAELATLLSRAALLTLTGPGGSGKTRLALRVAAESGSNFPGGIWLVELATVADPTLVPQFVASALGVRQEPGRPLIATLLDYLRDRQPLLIFDNCEHIVAACADLAEQLLRACPGLTILATSREPLGIGAEIVWSVPPLGVPAEPPLETPLDLAVLSNNEAVRLFADRARAIQPHFALSAVEVPAIARICRRLDGIPLAIELAAARANVLSAEQIAARLDDRFQLLSGGSRTALPRHRTLRALVDWSYDLLQDPEQALLRRLAVFTGGWTLEAAEAVAGCGKDTLELLSRLVDKSLVLVDRAGPETRYRLLETIRQYAQDRLQDAGEVTTVQTAHRDWFLALAEENEAKTWGAQQVAALDGLEREHDNLRAALAWCERSGETEVGLRLAAALWRFWSIRGYLSEGSAALEHFLTLAPRKSPVRARALVGAAFLSQVLGRTDAARAYADAGIVAAREVDEMPSMALGITVVVMQAATADDVRRARALCEDCRDRSRALGSAFGQAASLYSLGLLAEASGELSQAVSLFAESLESARATGDRWAAAHPTARLAHLALVQADYARATALYGEALVARGDIGDARSIPLCLDGLAWVACAQGHLDRAARLLGAEEALRQRVGAIVPPMTRTQHDLAIATLRAGLAPTMLETLWEQGRSMSLQQVISFALDEADVDVRSQSITPFPVPADLG